jgi:hypothetical protein
MRIPPILIIALACIAALPALAAQQDQSTPQNSAPSEPAEKTRIFVTQSDSWEIHGEWLLADGSAAGLERGGSSPQTVEIIKTFNQRCPDVIVTTHKDKADYVIVLDHEGDKEFLLHRNKIAVFNRDGDAIFTDSTLALAASVSNACASIRKDQAARQN